MSEPSLFPCARSSPPDGPENAPSSGAIPRNTGHKAGVARSLRAVEDAMTRAATLDCLFRSMANLLVMLAAYRFRVTTDSVWEGQSWPTQAAKARACVMYVMRTSWAECLSHEDVALLLGCNRTTVIDGVRRIEDMLDDDPALEHWLDGLATAIERQVEGEKYAR